MHPELKTVINRRYKELNPRTCGHQCCDARHSFGPAVRDNYLIHFVVSGKGMFETVRGRYSLSRGDIFTVRPGDIIYYEADAKEPWEYIWLSFDADMRLPSLITSRDHTFAPYLEDIFKSAFYHTDSTEGDAGYEEHLTSLLWEMVARMRREEASPSAECAEDYIRRAISIMSSELSEGINSESVAKRLHLNRSYFTTLFTEVTGMPPGEHLRLIRMERAASLLLSDDLSLSVIAVSVGYSDAFVFSRAFKKHFGISPSEYKNRFKRDKQKT